MPLQVNAATDCVAPTVDAPGRRSLVVALLVLSLAAMVVAPYTTWEQTLWLDLSAMLAAGSGVVGAGLLLVGRQSWPRFGRLGRVWVCFLLWAGASACLSGRLWEALVGESTNRFGLLTLAALTGVVLAGALHAVALQRLLTLFAPGMIVVQSAIVVAQLQSHATFPGGLLPNSTYLGEALLLLLPWTLRPVDHIAEGVRVRIRFGIAALAVLVLAASGSRVCMVLAALYVATWALRWSGSSARVRWLLVAATCGAAIVAAILVSGGEYRTSFTAAALGNRPAMARTAVAAVAARPVLGYGPDGFAAGGAAVSTPALAARGAAFLFGPGAADPHNILLWVAVSTGVVGLALVVWLLVEIAGGWWLGAGTRPEAVAAQWGAVAVLLVALTAPLALQVAPLLALVVGVSLERRRTIAESGAGVAYMRTAAAVVIAVSALTLGLNARARAPFEISGPKSSPPKCAGAQKAAALWSLDPHLAYMSGLHWGYAVVADPRLSSGRPDVAPMARAVALDVRNPIYAFDYARTLDVYRAPPKTVEAAFRETLRRWSLYPEARATFAVFLAKRGRFAEAREQVAIAQLVDDPGPVGRAAIERTLQLISQGDSARP